MIFDSRVTVGIYPFNISLFAYFNISLPCFRSVVGYKEHFMLGPRTIAMVLQYCGGGDLSTRVNAAKSDHAPFAEVTVRGGESGSVGMQVRMRVRAMVRVRVRARVRVRVRAWEREWECGLGQH